MDATEQELSVRFIRDILSCQGIILKICALYKKQLQDREDLYQDIIINAWKSYGHFRGDSKISTWLYKVALNTALHERRKNIFFAKTNPIHDAHHLCYEAFDTDEQMQQLYMAMEKLDPFEKSLVMLYMDRLSYREMSVITGLTESNIGVKLNRIKDKLKKLLASYGT